jgi:uncharacterized protein (DUF302 family)
MTNGQGLVHLESSFPVEETLRRLESLLSAGQIQIFCRIDHSGEAAKAGLSLCPTQLLVFGSPKAGTPLMVAAPSIAIDLPLKALVWQDDQGKVWLTYNSAEYLAQRHHLSDATPPALAAVVPFFEQAVRPG